jgi:predicted nucleotidyltransferase
MALINPVIEQRAAQALRVLGRYMKVCAGYIFGSHVDGTPDAYSDIDLAVFVEGIEAWDIFARADITAHVQREVGDDIELHYFPAQALKSSDPASFAAYVLHHGLPIEGTHDDM